MSGSRPAGITASTATTAQRLAILAGGFTGPFTGQILSVVLPQVADSFDISLSLAAASMSVYMYPFATMMLFSGRLTRSLPPHRVIMVAYGITFPLAVLVLFVPSWWMFALAYAVMGIANAFTTPMFQNILRAITPADKLGRALGTYAAMQSLGMLSAPLVSGLTAHMYWRLSFVVTASAALFILLAGAPRVAPAGSGDTSGSARSNAGPTIAHMATSFAIGCGIIGLGFLIGLYVGDEFGLGPTGRGLVVMAGGSAAFLLARAVGAAADRFGITTVLVTSSFVGALMFLLLPAAPWVGLVAVLWAVAVVAAQGMQATINLAVLRGPNGSSLISTVQAFRFGGSATSPVVFLPIYTAIGGGAFLISSIALVLAGITQWVMARR